MINTTIPRLTEPVADANDQSTFAARARTNFLEFNRVLQAMADFAGEANDMVATVNTQMASIAASFNIRPWVPGQSYGPGTIGSLTDRRDVVLVSGVWYVATVEHVAGASFATDLAAGKWLTTDTVQLRGDLANVGTGLGARMVGFTAASTVHDRLNEVPSIFDFMTLAQKASVLAGDLSVDVSSAFVMAADYPCVSVPGYKYLVNEGFDIDNNQTWLFQGAKLYRTSGVNSIIRANSVDDWAILGKALLYGRGAGAEIGIEVNQGKRYQVDGLIARNFTSGKGFYLYGANPTVVPENRGDRGQWNHCASYNCDIGRDIRPLAEYTIWTNFNAAGNRIGDQQAGGNTVTVGGNIVDNATGVYLGPGDNHLHGIHAGVNINHNNDYNIQAQGVVNGHEFANCHLYSNGGSTSKIVFDNCKGIVIDGGFLTSWIYNLVGASSGDNFVQNVYCPGSEVRCLDSLSGGVYPKELYVRDCFGPGAYFGGLPVSQPFKVYINARRLTNQTLVSATTTVLTWNDVQSNGNRGGHLNEATGVFTVPASDKGMYRIKCKPVFSGTALNAGASSIAIQVNGVSQFVGLLTPFGTTLLTGDMDNDFYLAAGATVQIIATITGTSPTHGASSAWLSQLTIERIA